MTKKKRKIKNPGFRPVVVDWYGLRAMGWPFSRVETTQRNVDGRYPQFSKLGPHHNARVLWRVADVLAYFEAHGLPVTEDWYRSLLDDEEERTDKEAAE
jgi:hypothetical protein